MPVQKKSGKLLKGHIYIYIYIYIYIIIVLFGPVKPELGVIPSGQENNLRGEHLNFPSIKVIYQT